jgi:hypothetical protein
MTKYCWKSAITKYCDTNACIIYVLCKISCITTKHVTPYGLDGMTRDAQILETIFVGDLK